MGEWTLKSSQRWLPGKKGRKGMDGRRDGGREDGREGGRGYYCNQNFCNLK